MAKKNFYTKVKKSIKRISLSRILFISVKVSLFLSKAENF